MSMKAFAPAIGQFRGGDSLFQSQVEANAMERLLGRTSERRRVALRADNHKRVCGIHKSGRITAYFLASKLLLDEHIYAACGASGALYTLICCVVGCGWLYSCFYRSKMRQQYGLKGNGCTDCLLHCCCESCTLSQEYRELKQRGFDMIIGAGKSKGFKDGLDEDGHAPSSPTEVKHSVEPLNTRRRGEEDDGLIHHDSDSKSPTNCPVAFGR
ncbi:hypothetical protein JHK85_017938 [Glycine max]|nr:hypothetical protein JHK85_017938 [Glycine max]